MLLIALFTACGDKEPTYDTASNLCGTIERPFGAPEAHTVAVVEVAEGQTACVGGDTGGGGWWGATVASPTPADDAFEAQVPVGTYGVEVIAGENSEYTGCAGVTVPDLSPCAAEVAVTLEYEEPVDKPNLYLYPTEPTALAVQIPAWRKITVADPRYPVEGWRVRAWPDGLLQTAAGPRGYLFYELLFDPDRFQTEQGWCAAGHQAQASIEEAMEAMGFLPNELADFAEGWDADFPEAAWVTVYPQTEGLSELLISPPPEHLLRVWFLVADGCAAVQEPELRAVPREGYHAAEWGVAIRAPLERTPVLVTGY